MGEKIKMTFRKKIFPIVYIAILCLSIGVVSNSTVKASDDPGAATISSVLISWHHLMYDHVIGEPVIHVDPQRLTACVPYSFQIKAPANLEIWTYVNFWITSGSSDVHGTIDTLSTDPTHTYAYADLTFDAPGTYTVSGRIEYVLAPDMHITVYLQPIQVVVNSVPMLSLENGVALYGPAVWTGASYQPVYPYDLEQGTPYIFHIHLYHFAQYNGDPRFAVTYQYQWDDNGPVQEITAFDDGNQQEGNNELVSHSFDIGWHHVSARAIWHDTWGIYQDVPTEWVSTWVNVQQHYPSTPTVNVYAYCDQDIYPFIDVQVGSQSGVATPDGVSFNVDEGTIYYNAPEYSQGNSYYYTFNYALIDGAYSGLPTSLEVYGETTVILYYNFHWQ